jgi:hypothetical protein
MGFGVIQLSLLFLEMKFMVEDKATLREKCCKWTRGECKIK